MQIIDIETDGIQNPTRVWCIVCKDVTTQEVRTFIEPDLNPEEFNAFSSRVDGWVGHNILRFDLPILKRLLLLPVGHTLLPELCIDTLVVSRLLDHSRLGGHRLAAWGETLGYPKDTFDDFSRLSDELISRCVQDCEINYALYNHLLPYITSPRWKEALRIEHDSSIFAQNLRDNGFGFNRQDAQRLTTSISLEIAELDGRISSAFGPRSKLVREVTPRATKHGCLHQGDFRWLEGGDLTPYQPGAGFSVISFEKFNPASSKQIVERLNEAGWKPFEKTKSHVIAEREKNAEALLQYRKTGWKVSEGNLSTLPEGAPEGARDLARRITLANRLVTIQSWIDASETTGRIHCNFNSCGTWTHRWSHAEPNVANVPTRPGAVYAHEMRSFFRAREGYTLVGVDADSIQLRILAHYMNDERFTHATTSGNKNNGTDSHTLNMVALGEVCKSRDAAKTFIYAWLLGAASGKVAEILECSVKQAKVAMKKFLDFYPGLVYVKTQLIPRDVRNGYFQGIDGRLVKNESEHHMLAGYLQTGEAVIMKKAQQIWGKELENEILTREIIPVNFVHDEWQSEARVDLAETCAEVQSRSIKTAGEYFGLNCPLLGTYGDGKKVTIGATWAETH